MSAARIRLTIDRLVLRGISPQKRDALMRGLHGELERLLAAPGFTEALRGSRVSSVRGGELRTAGDVGGGAELGKKAAQRVVQRIRG
jgi:hypothetical protein